MVDSVLEVKQIKQLSADGGATVVDVENQTIDGVTIGGSSAGAVTTTSLVATTADIDGGTIDGTVIGGTTTAAGSFTQINAGDGTFTDLHLSGGVYLGGTIESADYTSNSGATNGYVIRQGVGTSSSNALLEIVTSATSTRYYLAFRNGATAGNSSGSIVGSIRTSSSSTAYLTSSDYRLKTDIQPMIGAIDRLKQLNPVNFAWKVDGSRVDGFLAHEAQEVVPEAVTGEKDAVDAEGNPEYQGIDQSKLVPLLTAALQEAVSKIEALTARIEALENAAG